MIFQIKLMGAGKTTLNAIREEMRKSCQGHLAQVQVTGRILEAIKK
ncbi:hypothetical protein KRR23_04220 [Pseudomonas sp. CVAP|nr:hypothetical protein [Pseudomonas sp. CVAP\